MVGINRSHQEMPLRQHKCLDWLANEGSATTATQFSIRAKGWNKKAPLENATAATQIFTATKHN